jgi:hypothetical protein
MSFWGVSVAGSERSVDEPGAGAAPHRRRPSTQNDHLRAGAERRIEVRGSVLTRSIAITHDARSIPGGELDHETDSRGRLLTPIGGWRRKRDIAHRPPETA